MIDALDDSGSAKHAGFEEKEARRLRRQKRLEKAGKNAGLGPAGSRVVADPEFVAFSFWFCGFRDSRFVYVQSWTVGRSAQELAAAGTMESTERDESCSAEVR